jgi:hypothetical protein
MSGKAVHVNVHVHEHVNAHVDEFGNAKLHWDQAFQNRRALLSLRGSPR